MSTAPTQFVWKDEFNIGVELIDKEHQRLFKIINKLLAFREEEEKNSQWACQEGIKYFKTHAVKHFADEEDYMASIHYEGLPQHRLLHVGFRENTLPLLEKELEASGYSPQSVDHFLGVCAGWLIGHTMTEDLSIAGKYLQKWEDVLPGKELEPVKEVIAQQMWDMFQLHTQMISDSYGGERFGDGVYYRLVYGLDGEEKQMEVLIAFEERFLMNTVGKVMGHPNDKLDSTLIHAARHTAQQFVGRFLKHFANLEAYRLIGENLLTYEQLQEIFRREKLQISLLFNAEGAGYFAHCMIAPHLLEGGVGASIQADNAIAEVEKYLSERERQEAAVSGSSKRKILLVDDSATIRASIQTLLEPDYIISTVESGMAAIRAVVLDRPDLVLLDYEMPVCDGRQTLEMLRSERDFEDLPVIFLTSKRDPESMIKVMPLKPAGYVLKASKREDLKKQIDTFFTKQSS